MRSYVTLPTFVLAVALAGAGGLRAQTSAQTEKSKADAGAPAVDLSGVWEGNVPSDSSWAVYAFSPDVPAMTPWGMKKYLATKPSYGPRAVDPSTDYVNPTTGKDVGCLPPGVPRIYIQPFIFEIVQIRGRVIQLFEFDQRMRQIYTDGRQHPKDPDPTWMGDSIGWYEGDTLVIDSVGFNDKTWIDRAGLPHSDQLHVIERLRRPQPETLELNLTIEDPKTYTKAWSGYRKFKLRPTWSLKEFICADNADYNEEFINKSGAYTSPSPSKQSTKPVKPSK